MINLLPAETKKEIRREYRWRYITLTLRFITVSFLAGIIVNLPYAASLGADRFSSDWRSWVNLFSKGEELSPTENQMPEDSEQAIMMKDFDKLRSKLAVLDPSKLEKTVLPTSVIKAIIADKPSGVALDRISSNFDAKKGSSITVSGVASGRDDLVKFSESLSFDPMFPKVDLPVSNLSQKTDIYFTVNILIPIVKVPPAASPTTK